MINFNDLTRLQKPKYIITIFENFEPRNYQANLLELPPV